MKRALVLVVAVVAVVALAGCVNPPPSSPPVALKTPAPVGAEDAKQQLFRSVRAYTVRVRSVRCDEAGTGTGFAIDRRTIVTNRHVVETSRQLEVETWDGQSLAVASAEQAVGADLGIIHLAQDAPNVAAGLGKREPKVDAQLHFVGYPEGRVPRMNNGVVVGYPNDKGFDGSGKVMEMSGNAIPGNSGSPIVDGRGRVVGVVFAYEPATGWTIGVPLSRLRALLHGGARGPVVPC
jgi:S1-C subfamily serine protease